MQTFASFPDLQKPRIMPGSSFQFEVSDVDAAVTLANRFKDGGRYSYFRGQRNAEWPVRSTFARLEPERRGAANDAFNSFRSWVLRSPELVPYLINEDQLVAVAQHHGLCATTFIDLSTDPAVAGWFAADGAQVGETGALYLIDPERLRPMFDAISCDDLILRFVEVDVPNLWRLQAQSGLFLECTANLDAIWPLDRIVFPQDGTPARIERSRIYPTDRSQLEQMIDQHRLLNRREAAMRALLAGGGIVSIEIEEEPDAVPPEFGPLIRPSDWAAGPDERWPHVDPEPSVKRWIPSDLHERTATLEQLVLRRRDATHLLIVDADEPTVSQRLQGFIDRTWAGMRPYPYDAAAIARAIAAVARLEPFFRDFDLGAGLGTMPVARAVLVDPVEVEFGIAGGGASRACVTGRRLFAALSDVARRRLELPDAASGDMVLERLAPYSGKTLRCFSHDRLMDLFVDEIIPWQIVSKRDPISFSSQHIRTLGRP